MPIDIIDFYRILQMHISNLKNLLFGIFLLWFAVKSLNKKGRWKNIANNKECIIIVCSIIMFVCGFVILLFSITRLFGGK